MTEERRSTPAVDLDRRRALKVLGAGVGAVAAGTAVDNVLLGFEVLGTNLRKQDLAGLVAGSFFGQLRTTDVGSRRVLLWDDLLRVTRDEEGLETRRYPELDAAAAADLDARYDLDGLVEAGVPVLGDLHGDVSLAFSTSGSFFDRLAAGDPEPEAVELLRSGASAPADVVRTFAGADPADPGAVVDGLVGGFREHARYDYERYAAGAIQYNVLGGRVDVKEPFREDVGFRSLLSADELGMFCYEFADRSIEALHAVPAREQRVPVFAGRVHDRRHRHVYTAIGSVLREDDGYVVPMTFVDYMQPTMYDDLALRGVFGEGLEAYDRRHRATRVDWT